MVLYPCLTLSRTVDFPIYPVAPAITAVFLDGLILAFVNEPKKSGKLNAWTAVLSLLLLRVLVMECSCAGGAKDSTRTDNERRLVVASRTRMEFIGDMLCFYTNTRNVREIQWVEVDKIM
mmetsp:Transcript_375/g.625  ORF Transcript_375/g.625 Transcript_375/m.625 type:complete len:120 (+) Transcript_375:1003-1362(+)